MATEAHSPLEQFEIHRIVPINLGGFDVSFNNSAVFMVVAVVLASALMILAMGQRAMVPGRLQSVAELLYSFVADMVRDNAGTEGLRYFPFVFTLFIFVLFGNFLGLIPYAFTFTSHIVVTFGLAITVFILVTLIGLFRHGLHFFSLFLPHGTPLWLAPLIIPIELLSYLSRPVSLSVRLFANMLAGHTMLKLFGLFSGMLISGMAVLKIGAVLPLFMIVFVTGLEFLVAALQAYVFAVLTSIYLRDAIELH